ncbi:helix-turn-helix domain-containing protein [Pendulispora albinea]|uniref:Helix-turn-helix domain-containing protein n=1 Tax=Pendulispora albinea TaxID=2741071 RepID=A0ABZ2LV72_9BACT
MQSLTPKDHAEAVALYRSEIVGSLTRRELDRGQLAEALTELSQQRFRPPRGHSSRTYSVATLERWYYAYKEGGLEALRPQARCDRGRGREMPVALRELLVDIRHEHPSASVPLILQTLGADGRLEPGTVSASTVRRFFAERGLDKASLRAGGTRGKMRLRWQAEHPGALWQGMSAMARRSSIRPARRLCASTRSWMMRLATSLHLKP